MNISGLGYSSPYALNTVQGTSSTPAADDSTDSGTGDSTVSGAGKQHHHHGGGQMAEAMMQALQSIGLNMPPPPDASGGATASTANSATATASSDSPTDATSSNAPIDLRKDMGSLMHALFQAVKGEDGAGSTTTATAADGSGASSFAAGLSSLISQAANGTAPADLQTAFKTLTSDLQSLQGGANATTTASAGSTSTDSTASLQAFLSKLQSSLGYDATGSSASSSNLLNSVA